MHMPPGLLPTQVFFQSQALVQASGSCRFPELQSEMLWGPHLHPNNHQVLPISPPLALTRCLLSIQQPSASCQSLQSFLSSHNV